MSPNPIAESKNGRHLRGLVDRRLADFAAKKIMLAAETAASEANSVKR
jgi:hypothetical protein